MMRIITGSARGTKLATLEGDTTRPTSERTKEAVFSMIQFDIEGRTVLDLFAGSGQMGLEALSRGAMSAVFCDFSDEAVEIVRQNAMKTKLYSKCKIMRLDYKEYIRAASNSKRKFGIVFLDPPYKTNYIEKSLLLIHYGADIHYKLETQVNAAILSLILEDIDNAYNLIVNLNADITKLLK